MPPCLPTDSITGKTIGFAGRRSSTGGNSPEATIAANIGGSVYLGAGGTVGSTLVGSAVGFTGASVGFTGTSVALAGSAVFSALQAASAVPATASALAFKNSRRVILR